MEVSFIAYPKIYKENLSHSLQDIRPEGFFQLRISPNGEPRVTTFHVHDIPKYSVILHDCVIILMSRDRVNTFVIHRWCAFQRITRNIKE